MGTLGIYLAPASPSLPRSCSKIVSEGPPVRIDHGGEELSQLFLSKAKSSDSHLWAPRRYVRRRPRVQRWDALFSGFRMNLEQNRNIKCWAKTKRLSFDILSGSR